MRDQLADALDQAVAGARSMTAAEAIDRIAAGHGKMIRQDPKPWRNPHAGRVDPGTKVKRRAKNKTARKARRR